MKHDSVGEVKKEISILPPSRLHFQKYALAGKYLKGFPRVKHQLRCYLACLLTRGHIYVGALRSLRGHIRTLAPTGRPSLDLGLSPLLYPDGSTREAPYTVALAEGIAALEAAHPWLDTVDIHLFLTGFDLAAKFCGRTQDTEERSPISQPTS